MVDTKTLKYLCDSNDSCFVVIDIQDKLIQAMPGKVVERLKNNTSILLTACNELEIPVITTVQYPKGLGDIEQSILDTLPEPTPQIEKTCFSCVNAGEFTSQLKSLNRKQIVLVGIEAHICVLQTAFELLEDGYDVYVIADAIASRKLTNYDSAILRMNQAGIRIINTESVLFEWLRDASHPKFKSLSKLIL